MVLFNSLLLASAQPGAGLNQANLDRLRATKECPICDLSGAAQGTVTTLRDANMRGANMRGANMRSAILLALQSLTR